MLKKVLKIYVIYNLFSWWFYGISEAFRSYTEIDKERRACNCDYETVFRPAIWLACGKFKEGWRNLDS